MNISKITESLKGHDQRFPPVEKWNPELCDGHEFLIDRAVSYTHLTLPTIRSV